MFDTYVRAELKAEDGMNRRNKRWPVSVKTGAVETEASSKLIEGRTSARSAL
jgi:hypothetical protein